LGPAHISAVTHPAPDGGTMDRVKRFGVSLPRKTVERLDAAMEELGYDNRSKAIGDALADFMAQRRWDGKGGRFIGTIAYVYDHHAGDVTHLLTGIQHDHGDVIRSTMHSHITHDTCVEVMIVEGDAGDIRGLYGKISSLRGVENCKLAALAGR
jgi:CopG family transcriptional regulator, nickel-responsive regulator